MSTIGTRAPSTMPALAAPPRYSSCLASRLPASMSGTTSTSARPATAESMPLSRAARLETALSKASGPSTIAPTIWPRSAIFASAAASSVERIAGFTVSIALSTATRGQGRPSAWARSTAFCVIAAFWARSGAMLTAASVRMNGRA
ncbi:hypothetical protein XF14_17850 [Burkholderia gladioli]|nr:hypothetical protein XF14_17850 [Burkholderia gladioli]